MPNPKVELDQPLENLDGERYTWRDQGFEYDEDGEWISYDYHFVAMAEIRAELGAAKAEIETLTKIPASAKYIE